jgi:hypothetical protein
MHAKQNRSMSYNFQVFYLLLKWDLSKQLQIFYPDAEADPFSQGKTFSGSSGSS